MTHTETASAALTRATSMGARMNRPCCSECGRALPAPKTALVSVPTVDVDQMTDSELYAYRKRTALAGDLAFFLRGTLSQNLRIRALNLDKPTAKDMAALRSTWRAERCAYERANGIPALGSPAWREALDSPDLEIMEEATA